MSVPFRYCAVAILSCGSLVAKISTGTIVGVVEDASGAVIPNAQLTLRQTATGDTRRSIAAGSGEFNFPSSRSAPMP
jgi:hypothetical protein